jgi:O-antigen/teichoic acid export membrane protein
MSSSFVKNGVYNTVSGAVRIVLGVLTVPILVRTLGVQEYGLWTLVSSVVGMMSLLEGGFGSTTTVFVAQDVSAEDREGLSQTITVTLIGIFLLASVGAVGLWLEAIANGFPKLDLFHYATLVKALQLSSLVLWFRLLQQVLVAIGQGFQLYKETSVINTLQAILQSFGYILVPYFGGRTVELMFWQLLLSILFFSVYTVFSFRLFRDWSVSHDWNTKKSLDVLRYSISVWLSNLGGALFSQADKVLVGYVAGTATLGVYGAITSILSQINSMSAAPVQPVLPILTDHLAKGELAKVGLQLKKATQINCLVAVGLGSILMVGGDFLLPLILKSGSNQETILAYRLGVVIYTFYSMNAVGYYASFAAKNVNQCMVIVLASGVLSLMLIRVGVEYLGIVGGVMGNGGYLLSLLLVSESMKKMNMPMGQWFSWVLWPIVSFLFLAAFTVACSDYSLGLRVGQVVFSIPLVLWARKVVIYNRAVA